MKNKQQIKEFIELLENYIALCKEKSIGATETQLIVNTLNWVLKDYSKEENVKDV